MNSDTLVLYMYGVFKIDVGGGGGGYTRLRCGKGDKDNRPFPSCFEPRYESEAKSKVFVMKMSFHSYANKTIFI